MQLRRGIEVRAVFQGLAETVAWCRVAFDGDNPVLPTQHDAVQHDDDGFYPDDPGGEWGA